MGLTPLHTMKTMKTMKLMQDQQARETFRHVRDQELCICGHKNASHGYGDGDDITPDVMPEGSTTRIGLGACGAEVPLDQFADLIQEELICRTGRRVDMSVCGCEKFRGPEAPDPRLLAAIDVARDGQQSRWVKHLILKGLLECLHNRYGAANSWAEVEQVLAAIGAGDNDERLWDKLADGLESLKNIRLEPGSRP